jgi:hypothetical protein
MSAERVPMKIGLFIPRYVDAFFPEVGIATLQLLERLGCSVAYPLNQTCCGQPMANSGCQEDSAATEASQIAHYAMGHDLTLKQAALKLGFVTEDEFDRVVDPAKMVKPYMAAAG